MAQVGEWLQERAARLLPIPCGSGESGDPVSIPAAGGAPLAQAIASQIYHPRPSLGSGKFGSQNHFNLSLQERALPVRRPPDYVPVDPEGGMRQDVTKRDDSRPGYFRVAGSQLIGQTRRSLAYHGGLLYDRTSDKPRITESRMKGLRPFWDTRSFLRPSSLDKSNISPAWSRSPGSASGRKSTNISMSLSGRMVPRARGSEDGEISDTVSPADLRKLAFVHTN
jgi:hypothetical protein